MALPDWYTVALDCAHCASDQHNDGRRFPDARFYTAYNIAEQVYKSTITAGNRRSMATIEAFRYAKQALAYPAARTPTYGNNPHQPPQTG